MNYETTVDVSHARILSGDATAGAPADGEPSVDEACVDEARARRKRMLVAVAIAAALIAIAIFMLWGGEDEADFAPRETTAAVTVITPGRETVEGIINATGTLAARREMPVGVVGEGGRVVSVLVEPGDWVRQGQALAVIDRSVQNQQAVSSAAQIEVARADAELAQANLDRALQLVDRGFISQADVDRLTATRDAAVARVRVADAQHRELLARNDRLNIVAPEAGLVLERNVEPGQVVGSGATALFSIARGGEMELLARLGESDLATLSTGATATVVPVGTRKEFTGEIWQLSPVIDPQTRQGTARIALAYAPELRPGGFASTRINSGVVVAPLLPESAIQSNADGSFVYIVGSENKVTRRPVEIGMVTARGIIVESGLQGDERVVLRAGGFLTEGETIRPVTAGGSR